MLRDASPRTDWSLRLDHKMWGHLWIVLGSRNLFYHLWIVLGSRILLYHLGIVLGSRLLSYHLCIILGRRRRSAEGEKEILGAVAKLEEVLELMEIKYGEEQT